MKVMLKILLAVFILSADSLNLSAEKAPESLPERYEYYYNIADSLKSDNPILAEEYSYEALSTAKQLEDSTKISESSYLMGVIYYYLGKYKWSIDHLTKALDINEKLNDSSGVANSYTVIGAVFDVQEKFSRAIVFYKKALNYFRFMNDSAGVAASYGNIGLSYFYLNDYNKSMHYHNLSLDINEELNNKNNISINLSNIGNIFYDKKDFRKALDYYNKALSISESAEDKNGIARNLINIGTVYTDIKRYNKARQILKKGLTVSNDIGFIDGKFSAYEYLAKVDSATNNYESAFENQRKYYVMKDSVFSREVLTKIAQLEEKENIRERKEKARIKLEHDTRRNHLQYFGVFIFLVFLFVFVFMTGKIKMHVRVAEGLIFFTFILLFEFILVVLDPYIENISKGIPVFKLAANAALAILIFPIHSFFEETIKKKVVMEKVK